MRATPASHSAMFNGPTRSTLLWSLRIEAFADRRLHQGRVGLTARRLHDLPDEEADSLGLARAIVGDRGRVGRQDIVDRRGDRATVRDLAETPLGDDRGRDLTRQRVRLQDLAALGARDGS